MSEKNLKELLAKKKKSLASKEIDVALLKDEIKSLEEQLNPKEFWEKKLGFPIDFLRKKSLKIVVSGRTYYIKSATRFEYGCVYGLSTLRISCDSMITKWDVSFEFNNGSGVVNISENTFESIEIFADSSVFSKSSDILSSL